MNSGKNILVVCPHALEGKALGSQLMNAKKGTPPISLYNNNIFIVIGGVGKKRLKATLQELPLEEFHQAWLFGLAGGLSQDAVLGETYQARIVADRRRRKWHSPCSMSLPAQVLVTSARPVLARADRELLHEKSGAALVDMEGAVFADYCDEREMPWGVVRVVSDTLEHPEFKPENVILKAGLHRGARQFLKHLQEMIYAK